MDTRSFHHQSPYYNTTPMASFDTMFDYSRPMEHFVVPERVTPPSSAAEIIAEKLRSSISSNSSFEESAYGTIRSQTDTPPTSDPDPDSDTASINGCSGPGRYKTEVCRPFAENGFCKYGDKCQFAHGLNEMRDLSRHPKFKTEPCRSYHLNGFCPYGHRCNFVHGESTFAILEGAPALATSLSGFDELSLNIIDGCDGNSSVGGSVSPMSAFSPPLSSVTHNVPFLQRHPFLSPPHNRTSPTSLGGYSDSLPLSGFPQLIFPGRKAPTFGAGMRLPPPPQFSCMPPNSIAAANLPNFHPLHFTKEQLA